jgi:biopolymer transport protein ExbD
LWATATGEGGGMKKRLQDDSAGEVSIDISPLIDCVFILLIFFIVTTAFIEESGVSVDQLTAGSPSMINEDKPKVVIELLSSGNVTFNGFDTPLGTIQQMVKNEIGTRDDIPAIIKTAEDVPASVTVRAIDEAKLGGAASVLLGKL